jgi:hypothetical protein
LELERTRRRAALLAAGVDRIDLVNWWPTVQLATLNARFPADAHLDQHGVVIHYDPLTFLPWLNRRTWRSEWPKYRATDPLGIPPRRCHGSHVDQSVP